MVHVGAAEKLVVKREECGLLAAHPDASNGARRMSVQDVRKENVADVGIKPDEEGLVTLVGRLQALFWLSSLQHPFHSFERYISRALVCPGLLNWEIQTSF
ncbi:hypothetical protein LSUE1_G001707 [Lachnellula suecica]|uniref:Uncharacterized protein n=1 Tax=Lachnellula suecica TaxID=602035 RepID=A0A8T9C391_9HELO|nr:hypothetical protein LSUE1_G001707 [Lachnellula suecica]